MNIQKITEREYLSLINKLNQATEAYDQGHPTMSDKDWDDGYFFVKVLEKERGFASPLSPTKHVHFRTVSKLPVINHNHAMLSLDKTKDIAEVESFVSGHDWLAMFKMDGLTCSLTYKDGFLIRAETRGNGYAGEDILHNARTMPSIPQYIPKMGRIIIDGEVICTYEDFKDFQEDYKNPRNFAAGSIRLLSSEEASKRKLQFVAWDLIEGSDEDFFLRRFEQLDDWGFTVVPCIGDAETIQDAIKYLDNCDARKDYPIDGYVFKFMSVEYGSSLGATEHHFKNAIAYKFYDELYETKLLDIEWSMGRQGILTPIAIFEPVSIEGSEVSRASLSNISILKQTLGDPFVGQSIFVSKRNQIIPKIEKAKNEKGEWI